MTHSIPSFVSLADLASARIGARCVAANDEFFAPRSNLIKPEPALYIPGKFTTRGKWMDGWETRRRRTPGHDWCVVRLGARGAIRGIDVDTTFFDGNHPSHCSIDALDISPVLTSDAYAGAGGPWIPILPTSSLRGDSHNYFAVGGAGEQGSPASTYVRLNIYPDGGVARLRVYGDVIVDWAQAARRGRPIDLAEIRNGGLVLDASDMRFGAKTNMILPGRAANMGDGWETRRRRGPGHDWAIVRLGTAGLVQRIEIDTAHFKGNYPESASVDGCLAPGAALAALTSVEWQEILPRTKLKANHCHPFSRELRRIGPVSHVRLNIFPDGGISRFRVYGTVAAA